MTAYTVWRRLDLIAIFLHEELAKAFIAKHSDIGELDLVDFPLEDGEEANILSALHLMLVTSGVTS